MLKLQSPWNYNLGKINVLLSSPMSGSSRVLTGNLSSECVAHGELTSLEYSSGVQYSSGVHSPHSSNSQCC